MGYFFRPAIYKLTFQAKSFEHREEILKAIDSMFSFGRHYRFNDIGTPYEQPIWRNWGHFIHDNHYAEFMKKIFTIKGTIKEKEGGGYKDFEYDGDCLYYDDTSWVRKYPENHSYFPKPLVFKLRKEFKKLLLTDPVLIDEDCGWIKQHKKDLAQMREVEGNTEQMIEGYDDTWDPVPRALRQLHYILMGPFEEWVAW